MVGTEKDDTILMARTLPLFLLPLLLATPLVHAITLPELEQRLLEHDLRLRQSGEEIRLNTARQAQSEAVSGWSLFASVHGGRTEEIASAQSSRDYNTYGYTIGASYPLLDSRRALLQRENLARLQREAAELRAASATRQAVQQLRELYLELWLTEAQSRLARAFLATRPTTTRALALRHEQGLLLASEQQGWLAVFAEAENHASTAAQRATMLRDHIALLTATPLQPQQELVPAGFEAESDSLPTETPEVALAQREWEQQQRALRRDNALGVQSSLELSFSDGREQWAPTIPSRNLQATLNLRMPLELGKLQQGLREEALATLESSRLAYEQARRQAMLERAQALTEYHAQAAGQRSSILELEAAQQALAERTLRSQVIPDELEKGLQARRDYYRAARQRLEKWRQWQLATLRLGGLGALLRPSPTPQPVELAIPLRDKPSPKDEALVGRSAYAVATGSYVWNSVEALHSPSELIVQWQHYGLSRILLGLTRQQIDDPHLSEQISALVTKAHRAGIRVELVLGDPAWILPSGHSELLTILRYLSGLPLDGLNLDLEIEQLPDWGLKRRELTEAWFATLAAAAKVAPWPLGATFHQRHLGLPRLGSRLRAAGVANAAVMVYSTRQNSVLASVRRAQRAFAGLPMALVQSVERQLPPGESYASQGLAPLYAISRQLQRQGRPALLLQAWDDLRHLKP